ncbi:MAG: acyl-protein synthetase [Eubacterium sp.]|nr:acyl-protein synthetase [Eubacterium sp.]
MGMEEFYKYEPYELGADAKRELLCARLAELIDTHKENCSGYRNYMEKVGNSLFISESGICFDDKKIDREIDPHKPESIEETPFLPVGIFKKLNLKSISDDDVFKTMTSSGTTGQQVSKIFLDRETAKNQQKVLVEIVKSFTGSERMPMIILDCPSVVKDRAKFSARGAGILGFSIFGSKKIYAFDDDMNLDIDGIREFVNKYEDKTIFMFGFTFMIWEYFYKELARLADGKTDEVADEKALLNLQNAVLIHGGGWKKLANEAVSKEEFKDSLNRVCGIKQENVHDYYGMVEQTGCIYMECECGHLHASIYSDVITRRMKDFSACDFGEEGVIEVVSSLPESYPGHAILTEDMGTILGEDDCPCGRKGKYFEIHGRMAKAEVRGCSDTFSGRGR